MSGSGKVPALYAPTVEDMIAIADRALADMPPELAQMARGVSIHVEDFPDDDVIEDMELDSPFDILGLYQGVPFGEAEAVSVRADLDRIFLYRRPILDYWCETGEDLVHVVRHVLIHEIGHHFGLSDEQMEALEAAAESEDARR